MADDNAVKDEAVTPPADPAPDKETVTEAAPIDWSEDDDKPAKADPKPEPKVEEPEVKDEPDKPDEPEIPDPVDNQDKPPGKAQERKTQLNSEIRDLVSQRNDLKTEVEKLNAEVYQPATETELLDSKNPDTGETYTGVEAKIEALRQATEMDKYNTRVAEAQLTIEHEAARVINDFEIFNPDNESFDKELSDEAATLLQANLIIDENSGQVIGSNVSPYQLYKTIARAAGVSSAKGQIKGQQAAEKMIANADVSTNAAPPAKPKDPLMDMLVNWDSDD